MMLCLNLAANGQGGCGIETDPVFVLFVYYITFDYILD